MIGSLEVYVEDGQMYVYISTEDSTGWKKAIDGAWQVGEAVQEYFDTYQPI